MGIPSYFSYIIKNHGSILQKAMDITRNNIHFHSLYMDCNSILYDSYRDVTTTASSSKKRLSQDTLENEILKITIEKIQYYIEKIRPSDTIYIAFDGVAPFAKMEQQRTRRYRSMYESTIFSKPSTDNTENTDDELSQQSSMMFTPGTIFMQKLSKRMKTEFNCTGTTALCKFGVQHILIATPDEPGEGEHKLYAHIRENADKFAASSGQSHGVDNPKIAVYGLDADLIMLSLFHLTYAPEIYVFREAPAFAALYLDPDFNPNKNPDTNEPWFIDIAKLGRSLASEMDCSAPDPHRMNDYVFLCFFLGNDFLPHFPALNIRTHGIQRLMDIYRKCIGNTPERFLLSRTTPPTINWSEVTRFITELAKYETQFIHQEYSFRKKWDSKTPEQYPRKTIDDERRLLEDIPILFRQEETYISPKQDGWEYRYYQRLLSPTQTNMTKDDKKQVCIHYLEGLEWVCHYYTQGCMHWRWKYPHAYPPLLKDLAIYSPPLQTRFIHPNEDPYSMRPFHPNTQLLYVLSPNCHSTILPESVKKYIYDTNETYIQYFTPHKTRNDILQWNFHWSFCRYFWEAHVDTPHIPKELLDTWDFHISKLS